MKLTAIWQWGLFGHSDGFLGVVLIFDYHLVLLCIVQIVLLASRSAFPSVPFRIAKMSFEARKGSNRLTDFEMEQCKVSRKAEES
jgi:hypothetical protein